MTKLCCLIVIILCILHVSNCGRLTGNCLASNGTCGRKGFTCDDAFGKGWIDEGQCCSGRPCCKYLGVTNYRCGFETVAPCVFEDSSLDDFDWSRKTGFTDTRGTGPSAAAEGRYYIFTEAGNFYFPDTLMVIGAKAILTTEATNLQACPYCLSFKYHMRGVAIGSLEVFAGDKTSSLTSFWKKIGPQTQDPVIWDTGTIDIPQFSNLVITIVGSIGDGEGGDIAIDDIFLQASACNAGK
ncbi:unnamed protein product [Mytilus coruscus]|uniref:MAM domain-containing protein n=1 Tax=Mytilus coruscus TaxID=42192 RepID=A0A6J8CXU0_MYTCO|nr:unnamed protein product [Mytilus coruscus]